MLFVSLRDLQWRRKRFAIGVLATGLVFALAVVITGISGSFRNEVDRAVAVFDADQWLVADPISGPFTTASAFEAALADEVRALPGVEQAEPVVMLRVTVRVPDAQDVNLVGVTAGGTGAPDVTDGRPLAAPGEIVADRSLGLDVGDRLDVSSREFEVVGVTSGVTYLAGTPAAFIDIADAQQIALGGLDLATSIVVDGEATDPPAPLRAMSNDEVVADLRRPLTQATDTIDMMRILLWIVAAGIIGSVVFLQAMERTRDFAVLKATGATNRTLVLGLAFQAVVLALLAAVAALVLSALLGPLMPMQVEVPASAYVLLPIVAVVVGLLASIAGLRRAISVDPALAFGGA